MSDQNNDYLKDLLRESAKKLKEAIEKSGKTQTEIFAAIGITNASQISQILDPNNRKSLPAHLIGKFCQAVDNTLYLDWQYEISGYAFAQIIQKTSEMNRSADTITELAACKKELEAYKRLIALAETGTDLKKNLERYIEFLIQESIRSP